MKMIGLLLFMLLAGCAYNAPMKPTEIYNSAEFNIPFDKAWQKAIKVLAEQGFTIRNINKDDGLISAEKSYVKLDELQADCGNIMGIPYLKDDRATPHVVYAVFLEKSGGNTKITVNTSIDATFNATANSETKHLSCFSLGYLEYDFIDRIKR